MNKTFEIYQIETPIEQENPIEEMRHELTQIQQALWMGELEAVRESVLRIVRDMEWTVTKLEQNQLQAKGR